MPELTFQEEGHIYRLGGEIVPSVTTVLEAEGFYKLDGIPESVLDFAGKRGDLGHAATALYDLNDLDETALDAQLRPYLEAWKLFRDEAMFTPKLVEHWVCSVTRLYAGTLDRTGLLGFVPAVLDIKLTAQMSATTGIQLAAYLEALGDPTIRKRVGVQLRPDGTYRMQEYKDRNDFKVWHNALENYQWKVKNL